SPFRITRSSAIAGRTIARTVLMVSCLTGVLISMAPNPKWLFPARTGHANCRKPSPSLTGFCVYTFGQAAPQEGSWLRRLLDSAHTTLPLIGCCFLRLYDLPRVFLRGVPDHAASRRRFLNIRNVI